MFAQFGPQRVLYRLAKVLRQPGGQSVPPQRGAHRDETQAPLGEPPGVGYRERALADQVPGMTLGIGMLAREGERKGGALPPHARQQVIRIAGNPSARLPRRDGPELPRAVRRDDNVEQQVVRVEVRDLDLAAAQTKEPGGAFRFDGFQNGQVHIQGCAHKQDRPAQQSQYSRTFTSKPANSFSAFRRPDHCRRGRKESPAMVCVALCHRLRRWAEGSVLKA